jgi:hypothetical protein
MLVLIVMAASFLIVELIRESTGNTLNRFWISMGLVLCAQLPVAIQYARSETRNLTSVEGWALSTVFVGVTLALEFILQSIAGQRILDVLPAQILDHTDASNHQTIWVIGCIVGLLAASFTAKTLFRYAVRNNLMSKRTNKGPSVLDVVPGLNSTRFQLRRPRAKRDYAELYRRELIGANIAIFGLSLMVFGPQFMHVLKLSIPLSFVFSLVCVANRMARVERTRALSERCLNVALQMLPMTVFSMTLLGLSTLYGNYVTLHGGERDVIGYVVWMVEGLGLAPSDVVQISAYVGVLFAICLAGNTLLLVLFAKLIQPLVFKGTKIVQAKSVSGAEKLNSAGTPDALVHVIAAKELVVRSKAKQSRTQRPFRVKIV